MTCKHVSVQPNRVGKTQTLIFVPWSKTLTEYTVTRKTNVHHFLAKISHLANLQFETMLIIVKTSRERYLAIEKGDATVDELGVTFCCNFYEAQSSLHGGCNVKRWTQKMFFLSRQTMRSLCRFVVLLPVLLPVLVCSIKVLRACVFKVNLLSWGEFPPVSGTCQTSDFISIEDHVLCVDPVMVSCNMMLKMFISSTYGMSWRSCDLSRSASYKASDFRTFIWALDACLYMNELLQLCYVKSLSKNECDIICIGKVHDFSSSLHHTQPGQFPVAGNEDCLIMGYT